MLARACVTSKTRPDTPTPARHGGTTVAATPSIVTRHTPWRRAWVTEPDPYEMAPAVVAAVMWSAIQGRAGTVFPLRLVDLWPRLATTEADTKFAITQLVRVLVPEPCDDRAELETRARHAILTAASELSAALDEVTSDDIADVISPYWLSWREGPRPE